MNINKSDKLYKQIKKLINNMDDFDNLKNINNFLDKSWKSTLKQYKKMGRTKSRGDVRVINTPIKNICDNCEFNDLPLEEYRVIFY